MSVTVYVVRHGEAASGWDEDPNPGLSAKGLFQAKGAAETLQSLMGPVQLTSSPLLRAQETAHPLEEMWKCSANINGAISEIPSTHIPFSERRAWLTRLMAGKWSEQHDILRNWRAGILDFVASLEQDTILFSHFMVINALVGAIEAEDKTLIFRPDNGSITKILVENQQLSLIERGCEAITEVR